MISRLHYLSEETDENGHLQNIKEACASGVDWVELGIDDLEAEEFEEIAFEAKSVCKKYNASLIINGNVEIAKAVRANGVMLSQDDMDPVEARSILGDKPYIGAAANTWEEVELLYESKVVDFITLGPFQATDKNLNPALGITGYSNVLNNMIIQDIDIPIFATGGIELESIFDLQLTGCYGVAIDSLINNSFDKKETIEEIKLLLPDASFDEPDSTSGSEEDFEY